LLTVPTLSHCCRYGGARSLWLSSISLMTLGIDWIPPLSHALKVTTLAVSPWINTGGTVVVLPIAWLCLSVVSTDWHSVPNYPLVSTRACDVFAWNCGVTNVHRGYELSVARTISLCCLMLKIARYGLSTSAAIMSGKFSIWVLVIKSQSTTPRYPNNFVFLAIPV
jgi:hypothetical protein